MGKQTPERAATVGSAASALVVLGVILLAGEAQLGRPTPTGDETCYVHAARALLEGREVYAARCYLYPPLLAHALAAGMRWLGEPQSLLLLRVANTLGLSLACVLSARVWTGLRLFPSLALAVLLALSPSAAEVARFGNVSGLATGLALLGMTIWPRHPHLAGMSLGGSVLLKPLLLAAPWTLVLAIAREHRAAARTVALSAAATAVLLTLPGFPWIASWLSQGKGLGQLTASHNLSLARALLALDVPHAGPLLAAASLAACGWLAVRLRPQGAAILVLACAGSVAASPIVWRHSLVMAYPCIVAAAARLWRDRAELPVSLLVAGLLAIALSLANDFFVLSPELVSFAVWMAAFAPVALSPVIAAAVALWPITRKRAAA